MKLKNVSYYKFFGIFLYFIGLSFLTIVAAFPTISPLRLVPPSTSIDAGVYVKKFSTVVSSSGYVLLEPPTEIVEILRTHRSNFDGLLFKKYYTGETFCRDSDLSSRIYKANGVLAYSISAPTFVEHAKDLNVGCQQINGRYFLLGSGERSIDSRYFGMVESTPSASHFYKL